MLDTLLKIGKTLRKSGKPSYHRYIQKVLAKEKNVEIVYFILPVNEDFSFDFTSLKENFHNENEIENFHFLEFKSSDNDRTSCKYIWGDIFYETDKDGKEKSWYKLSKSSFTRTIPDEANFFGTNIEKFRKSFAKNQERIEGLLRENSKGKVCYLHFDFQGEKKHWFQFEEELNLINKIMLSEFLIKQNGFLTLKKYLHKTLRSFNEKDAIFQLPNMAKGNEYKTKSFSNEKEFLDLLYAIDFSKKYIIGIGQTIGINVLPNGDDLSPDNIEEYFSKKGLANHANAVGILSELNQSDEFLQPFISEVAKPFTQFDVIFTDTSGNTHTDIIELSGLERDLLVELDERIRSIRIQMEDKRKDLFSGIDSLPQFGIKNSFTNILGKLNNKLTSHLVKVLPRIYLGNYYRDEVLLPAFIEKVQFDTRKGVKNFNLLKFDYEFLVKLRNSLGNTDREITNMKDNVNYKIGLLLGHMAQPVSRDINSFEKGFVGLLSRHISDYKALIKFSNFINSKLSIHNRITNKVRKWSTELENVIGAIRKDDLPNFAELKIKVDLLIKEIDERQYNLEYCAFGFFEGYFCKYLKSREDLTPQGDNNDK